MPSAGAAPNPSRAPSEETGSPISDTPDITNHYTVFPKTIPKGPPPAGPFSIPLSTLRREFFDIQALVHPDKFPSGPQKQRAEALSSRINEAYRTLADPLSRAQYLLAYLHNVDVNAEDGAQTHPHDKETLMQVLEVQEAIEEAEDETLIAELRTENEQRIDECVDTLGKALEREDVETARAECVKLRFWYNIRDCLREWEPGKEVRVVH
jgi:molecular chaperone HscB